MSNTWKLSVLVVPALIVGTLTAIAPPQPTAASATVTNAKATARAVSMGRVVSSMRQAGRWTQPLHASS
jgi:hypothetical protein